MNGKGIWLLSSTHYHQSPTNSSELFKSLFERTLCQKHFRHGARWRHVFWHRGWTSSNGQWSFWRYVLLKMDGFSIAILAYQGVKNYACYITVFVLCCLLIFTWWVFSVVNGSHGKDNLGMQKKCSMAKHTLTYIKSGCHLKGAHGESPED